MTTAVEQEACRLVARALGVQGEIPLEGRPATLPAWDSLAHTRLVLELEACLGRPLDWQEIAGLDSVRAVARILAAAAR